MPEGSLRRFVNKRRRLLNFARRTYPPFHYWSLKKNYFKKIDRKEDSEKIMINIGGGNYFRRHWKVLDFPSKWYSHFPGSIDIEFDLTNGKKFPVKDNSVTFFYSSHTLEHIPQEYCQHILNEISIMIS